MDERQEYESMRRHIIVKCMVSTAAMIIALSLAVAYVARAL